MRLFLSRVFIPLSCVNSYLVRLFLHLFELISPLPQPRPLHVSFWLSESTSPKARTGRARLILELIYSGRARQRKGYLENAWETEGDCVQISVSANS